MSEEWTENENAQTLMEAAEAEASAPAQRRDIEVITEEIQFYKAQAGASIVEIGKRLIEAKEKLEHGEWLPWLSEKVNFSESMAQRFMRVAREYANPAPVRDLGLSKALILLEVEEEKREQFLQERHSVNGEEKTVYEMSRKELEQAVRERDEAQDRAKTVEKDLSDQLKEAKAQAADYAEALEKAKAQAAEEAIRAKEEAERLRKELEAVQSAPTSVAVETVTDEAAVQAAAEQGRREAEEALRAQIDKTEKAREKAEKAKARAEQELAALKVAREEAESVAREEKKAMEANLEQLRKQLAVASSSEMVIFKLHFEEAQEAVNKMNGCIEKLRTAGDDEHADKLRAALKALLQASLDALGG